MRSDSIGTRVRSCSAMLLRLPGGVDACLVMRSWPSLLLVVMCVAPFMVMAMMAAALALCTLGWPLLCVHEPNPHVRTGGDCRACRTATSITMCVLFLGVFVFVFDGRLVALLLSVGLLDALRAGPSRLAGMGVFMHVRMSMGQPPTCCNISWDGAVDRRFARGFPLL